MAFSLNPECVFTVRSNPLAASSSRIPSPIRRSGASFNFATLSFLPVVSEEGMVSSKEPPESHISIPLKPIRNSKTESLKIGKSSCDSIVSMIDETDVTIGQCSSSSQKCGTSHACLLMENLDVLEETIAASDRLEKDILMQLGKIGALELYYTNLPRTLKCSSVLSLSDSPASSRLYKDRSNDSVDCHIGKTIVHSGRKKERRKKRSKIASDSRKEVSSPLLHSDTVDGGFQIQTLSSLNSCHQRFRIATNEAEISKGIKVVAKLERIKATLEKQTGSVASLSCWAEAAGVSNKALQEHLLFGRCCKEELLRNTRDLVVFLARNYRGLGIAYRDLIQAGNSGVLQGAERFDHTRGYKFSTYLHFWIRKSISSMVALHGRGIRIPYELGRAVYKINKARKTLRTKHGKHPQDAEIAKLTGLSLAKISSASKCMTIVGSLDAKIDACYSTTYLEVLPDMSIESPDDMVSKQHMKKDIHDLLNCLDSREKQVMILRYGLSDAHPTSLEEIGKLFQVSKEWIRKIELKAMSKLRDEESHRNLSHYLEL